MVAHVLLGEFAHLGIGIKAKHGKDLLVYVISLLTSELESRQSQRRGRLVLRASLLTSELESRQSRIKRGMLVRTSLLTSELESRQSCDVFHVTD